MTSKKKYLLLLLLIFGLLIGSTFLVRWSLLDDGITIINSRKIDFFLIHGQWSDLGGFFIEKEVGRFRPVYWLYNWFVYKIAGANIVTYFIFRGITLFSTLLLIVKTFEKIKSSLVASLVGSSFFLLTFLNVDNIYRLGPVEPLATVMYALLIFGFVDYCSNRYRFSFKNLAAMLVSSVSLYFIKETFIVLVPLIATLFLYIRLILKPTRANYSTLWILFCVNIAVAAGLAPILNLLKATGSYSQNYHISFDAIYGSFRSYVGFLNESLFPFLLIVPIVFILTEIRSATTFLRELKKLNWIIILSVFALFCGAMLLPWGIPLGRYMMPFLVPFSLVWGIISGFVYNNIEKYNKDIARYALFFYFVIFTYLNIPRIINFASSYISATQRANATLSYIAKGAPKDSTVWLNLVKSDATIEIFYESGYHLGLFYGRPDLKTKYLGDGKIAGQDTVISGFVSDNYKLIDDSKIGDTLGLSIEKVFKFSEFGVETQTTQDIWNSLRDFQLVGLFQRPLLKIDNKEETWYVYKKL